MKLEEQQLNEFSNPQQVMQLIGWMLQGLAMSPDNTKLVKAYQAILTIFNE